MPKEAVDSRQLKDSAAEYLKKSKFEKAAEVLEELAKAEPKEMQHRLRLGDCYRRLERPEQSIAQYQAVAKHYADQGQLIKAIAAVKVVLEIDPKNAEARKHLADMNERRMGKVTLERPGLSPPKPAGAGARPAKPIELPDDDAEAAAALGSELDPIPLEDDELPRPPTGKVPPAKSRGAQRGAMADRARPAPGDLPPELQLEGERLDVEGERLELDDRPRKPARKGVITPPQPAEMALDPDEEEDVEALPDDAILGPEAEDLVASPDDENIIGPPPEEPVRRRKPRPAGRKKEPEPVIEVEVEPARPIADLLGSDAEEEIELLSTSEDRPPAEEPDEEASGKDIEEAFGAIAPKGKGRKLPARVPLFDDLAQDAFVELVNKLSYRRYRAGERILREGEPGRSFFVIVEGKVRIWKQLPEGEELQLAILDEGAFFGEMALLSGAPRTANVSALEDTELLEVTDSVLRELARSHPQVVRSLKNFYRQRLLNNVMAISPLFKDFDPSERRQIVEKFRLRQAAPGEIIIKEGSLSDGLYVVLHGSVEVATRQIDLAKLREGDIFGEMSLLTRKPAISTVTSPQNSILLRLPKERFQELVVTHPQILALVSQLTEERAAATRAALKKHGISSFV